MKPESTGIALYDRTADAAAGEVIRRYSTSFGMAAMLLGPRVRPHVRNIYALVRVADEIVDGPGEEAGMSNAEAHAVLDDLERETLAAIDRGFSANLIVHAFARTARASGIAADLVDPVLLVDAHRPHRRRRTTRRRTTTTCTDRPRSSG